MTYFLTAHENTRARLIADESRTSSPVVAAAIRAAYEAQGWIVVERTES